MSGRPQLCLWKKAAKSSGICRASVGGVVASPSTSFSARRSFFILRHKHRSLSSSSCCTCFGKAAASFSVCRTRPACLCRTVYAWTVSRQLWHRAYCRADRQSASNHDVACIFLRRTVTSGQCLSSSWESCWSYSCTRSSTYTAYPGHVRVATAQITSAPVTGQSSPCSTVHILESGLDCSKGNVHITVQARDQLTRRPPTSTLRMPVFAADNQVQYMTGDVSWLGDMLNAVQRLQ